MKSPFEVKRITELREADLALLFQFAKRHQLARPIESFLRSNSTAKPNPLWEPRVVFNTHFERGNNPCVCTWTLTSSKDCVNPRLELADVVFRGFLATSIFLDTPGAVTYVRGAFEKDIAALQAKLDRPILVVRFPPPSEERFMTDLGFHRGPMMKPNEKDPEAHVWRRLFQ